MNDKHIQVLLAIAANPTVSKAAQQLHLRQPTLHFHMKNMEEEYQMPLFLRRSGRIILSDQAKILLHYAQKIHTLQLDAKEKVLSFSMNRERVFKIGASMVPCKYVVLDLLKEFQKQYPHIPVSLQSHSAPTIIQMIQKMELDIAIVASSNPPTHSELTCERLMDDPMALVYSPKNERMRTLLDLQKECLLMHHENSSTHKYATRWIQEQNLHFDHIWYGDSNEIIKSMVIHNLGISILPYISIEEEVKKGLLCATSLHLDNMERHFYIIYNHEQFELPVRQAFLDILKNTYD